MAVFSRIFGSRNQRIIGRYNKVAKRISGLEDELKSLSDERLTERSTTLRERHDNGETLDDLLVEAFALVREAANRTLGMRHYDVQHIGAMVLHNGDISEMRTGEGKTLMATSAAYLNALDGKGVHIVTVNEYLASRDAEWMRPVYELLGLTVGVVRSGMSTEEKRAAYECDITYATNNELGFDYLRDNLAFRLEDRVQRELSFAIVDEVDSILIDEARTPLIISGPSEQRTDLYVRINKLVPSLALQEVEEEAPDPMNLRGPVEELSDDERGDFTLDRKAKQVHLTEQGHENAERLMTKSGLIEAGTSLYDPGNIKLLHHLTAALRAHHLYTRDNEYIVQEGEVVIVDEFTGRTMPGRRWSDGLHQAVEAKENVLVKEENQTVASITFQNFFRLYDKLSGMTGTADTEAFEFQQIYGLEVVVIPTHRPMVRDDRSDLVFLTQNDKFDAIVDEIAECRENKQPVLVGTTSIETSELLSKALKQRKVPHEVLNAKQHEREARIVEQAGRPGAITIATNMAGRGTDIVLGGNLEAELRDLGDEAPESERGKVREDWQKRHDSVLEAGGLHIVGTERHESRRIDNQLRGRSGRQGDPGSSRFFLSMEDTLMRIFGDPDRMKALLQRVGMREGEAIESGLLTRQIEKAQRKVEAHNFDMRKNLLEYDDVANEQRKVVYHQRTELMGADDIADSIGEIRAEVVDALVDEYFPPNSIDEQWEPAGLAAALEGEFGVQLDVQGWLAEDNKLNADGVRERVQAAVDATYGEKVEEIGADTMRLVEKQIMLMQLDSDWKEHLAALDYLRQGIGLRSYAQRNPKQEYKREAFEMFGSMLDTVKREAIMKLARIRVRSEEEIEELEARRRKERALKFQHADAQVLGAAAAGGGAAGAPAAAVAGAGGPPRAAAQPLPETFRREAPKVGRNQPCPCGSGKKYKHCHGKLS
ncbi:MAG: preprotein translocase subunit SecA [Pseudomonadota bacterium]